VLEEHNKRLQSKFARMKEAETRFEAFNTRDSDVILVAYGSVARMAKAAMAMARAKGLRAGLIRPITLWPFPDKAIREAADRAKKFLVVEMSAGQMAEDVERALKGSADVYFYGRMGGGIPSEEEIFGRIMAIV
jgi:2-oxoglutarate ferredoxin oxidoreductase subunit alpha